MEDARIGSVLDGRYRIDARLAAGGTGIVYVGTQLGLSRRVAIKFLHQSSAKSSTHTGRFEREARVMSKLGHPNIAQIIDFGSDDDSRYLVMELCEGTSLRDAIAEGPIELHRATHIARQILAGLAHAHDHSIVHRDLKPGNVLLVDSVAEDHVKILDFGVAKIMSPDGPTELSVAARGPLGTPHYMSPEQAKSQAVDSRADLYALGVILYEMTTGRRPFDAGAGFALLRQHVEDAPSSPRAVREMSEELESVILRAMQKDADDRFQTAAEMADALSEVPEADVARSATSPRRKIAVWGGVVAACLATAVAVTVFGSRQGWFDRSSSGRPLAAHPALASIDAGAAGRDSAAGAGDARPTGDLAAPPWTPPAAIVTLSPEAQFPAIDNQGLAGKVAARPFEPRFAALMVDGGDVILRLTSDLPETRLCSALEDADLGAAVSIELARVPVEKETARSSGRSEILVAMEGAYSSLRVRWQIRFDKVDANEQTVAGRINLRGRDTRIAGDFAAAYCPEFRAGDVPRPQVNGVKWSASSAPEPELLPAQSVAGAFDQLEFKPAHVQLADGGDPASATLTFFGKTPPESCAKLGKRDVGAVVNLPAGSLEDLALSMPLSGDTSAPNVSAVFHIRSQCPGFDIDCAQAAVVPASMLAVKVDAVFPSEFHGRIYLAAPDRRRILLVGAFRARDCRSALPEEPASAVVDAGGASDAGVAADAAIKPEDAG